QSTFTGNFGRPGLSTNGTIVALTYLTSDRKVHAYTRTVPFLNNTWSTVKDGPTLPTGVTADGVPAITYVRGPGGSATNKFVIIVRGISGGTAGLWWIYF